MILSKERERLIISSETDIDYSVWKILALWLAGALTAFCFGYFFAAGRFIPGLLTGTLLLIIFTFQSFFVKNFARTALSIFIETLIIAAVIAFYYRDLPSGVLPIAVILFYLFVLSGHYAGLREAQNNLRINYFKIARAVLPTAVTGLSVLIALVSGFSLDAAKLSSDVYFAALFKPLNPVVKFYLPSFSPEMPAGDFLSQFTKQMLDRQNLMTEIDKLPEEQKQKVLEQATAELKKSLEHYAGSTIETDASVADNLAKIFRHRVNDLFLKYPPFYLSLIFSLIIFFLIKGAVFFLYWLIALLGFIVYETLIITNFLTIRFETRDKEIVVLK